MIYFGYCRLSKPQEYQAESLHQKNAISNYVKENKINLEEIYEDKGSGRMTQNLPQMRELLNNLEYIEGEKTILVSEVSRICRGMMCWELMKQDFKKYQVNVYAINQKTFFKWNNGSGNGPFNQLALTASEEWESISDRVRSEVSRRRQLGLGMGRPAVGYKRDENGKFVEDREEQNILKIMQTMYKKRKPMQQIKEHFEIYGIQLREMPITINKIRYYLNKMGARTPAKKPIRKTIKKKSAKDPLSKLMGKMNIKQRTKTYEVEDVLGKKIEKVNGRKQTFYLIKWKNYPVSDNSWEPEANLTPEAKAMFYE